MSEATKPYVQMGTRLEVVCGLMHITINHTHEGVIIDVYDEWEMLHTACIEHPIPRDEADYEEWEDGSFMEGDNE